MHPTARTEQRTPKREQGTEEGTKEPARNPANRRGKPPPEERGTRAEGERTQAPPGGGRTTQQGGEGAPRIRTPRPPTPPQPDQNPHPPEPVRSYHQACKDSLKNREHKKTSRKTCIVQGEKRDGEEHTLTCLREGSAHSVSCFFPLPSPSSREAPQQPEDFCWLLPSTSLGEP